MTSKEFGLLIELAIIVRGLASPDDQRAIDRRISDMEAETADEVEEQERSEA